MWNVEALFTVTSTAMHDGEREGRQRSRVCTVSRLRHDPAVREAHLAPVEECSSIPVHEQSSPRSAANFPRLHFACMYVGLWGLHEC